MGLVEGPESKEGIRKVRLCAKWGTRDPERVQRSGDKGLSKGRWWRRAEPPACWIKRGRIWEGRIGKRACWGRLRTAVMCPQGVHEWGGWLLSWGHRL